jgi:hypothetical protein
MSTQWLVSLFYWDEFLCEYRQMLNMWGIEVYLLDFLDSAIFICYMYDSMKCYMHLVLQQCYLQLSVLFYIENYIRQMFNILVSGQHTACSSTYLVRFGSMAWCDTTFAIHGLLIVACCAYLVNSLVALLDLWPGDVSPFKVLLIMNILDFFFEDLRSF